MPSVDDQVTLSAVPARGGSSSVSLRQPRNDILMWVLLTLTALAPLPFGSNRPFFWAAWGALIGISGCIYMLATLRDGRSLRTSMASIKPQAGAFAIVCLYLIFQMLPLGEWQIISSLGVTISTDSVSIAKGDTLLMLLRMLTYGIYFYLIMQITPNLSRRTLFLNGLLVVICIYAVIGQISLYFGDTILGLPKWAHLGSATGTFVNRNSFATFLAFGGCIAAVLLMDRVFKLLSHDIAERRASNNGSWLAIYGACLVIVIATVFATQSRMGLFVTVAGCGVIILSAVVRNIRNVMASVLILVLCAAIFGFAFYLNGGGLFDRFSFVEQSSEVRLELYRQIVELISLRPWTGWGGGTFQVAFPLVHALPVNADVVWSEGHNTYLTLWSELGVIVGSIPILIFLFAGVRLIVSLIQRQSDWTAKTIALATLVVGGLHSLVDFSLEIQADTFVFLALVAAGLVTTMRRKEESI